MGILYSSETHVIFSQSTRRDIQEYTLHCYCLKNHQFSNFSQSPLAHTFYLSYFSYVFSLANLTARTAHETDHHITGIITSSYSENSRFLALNAAYCDRGFSWYSSVLPPNGRTTIIRSHDHCHVLHNSYFIIIKLFGATYLKLSRCKVERKIVTVNRRAPIHEDVWWCGSIDPYIHNLCDLSTYNYDKILWPQKVLLILSLSWTSCISQG
jgi:hypothetical protein